MSSLICGTIIISVSLAEDDSYHILRFVGSICYTPPIPGGSSGRGEDARSARN